MVAQEFITADADGAAYFQTTTEFGDVWLQQVGADGVSGFDVLVAYNDAAQRPAAPQPDPNYKPKGGGSRQWVPNPNRPTGGFWLDPGPTPDGSPYYPWPQGSQNPGWEGYQGDDGNDYWVPPGYAPGPNGNPAPVPPAKPKNPGVLGNPQPPQPIKRRQGAPLPPPNPGNPPAPNGADVQLLPGGGTIQRNRDGSSTTWLPDGTIVQADGQGGATVTMPDGTVVQTDGKGGTVIWYPNGDVRVKNRDGSVTFYPADPTKPVTTTAAQQ